MTITGDQTEPSHYTPQEVQTGFICYAVEIAQHWTNGSFLSYNDRYVDTYTWLKFADEIIGSFLDAIAGRPTGSVNQFKTRVTPDSPTFNSRIDVRRPDSKIIHDINYGVLGASRLHIHEREKNIQAVDNMGKIANTPYCFRILLNNKLSDLALKAHYNNVPNEDKVNQFIRNILWFFDNGDIVFGDIILKASYTKDEKEICTARGLRYVEDNTAYSGLDTSFVKEFDRLIIKG